MGWTEQDKIPRSTIASFILLAVYVIAKLSSTRLPDAVHLFQTGCLFMGGFVYYLGLLVMSSKWYDEKANWTRYLWMQVLTIGSGLAALYLGATYNIGTLLGLGGTFFAIYLLEKYWEIPWEGAGWAWAALGMAVFLYVFVGFAQAHPQYFVWSIKLVE
jgi:hypothetical protein